MICDKFAERSGSVIRSDLFEVLCGNSLSSGRQMINFFFDVDKVLKSMEEDRISLERVVAAFKVFLIDLVILAQVIEISTQKIHLLFFF